MKQKQAHLKAILALGFVTIVGIITFYFPLQLAILFLVFAVIAIYMSFYTLFKD
jgi:hypothetical protein